MIASNFHFGIRVFDAAVRLTASCEQARDVLDRYIFPTWPRIEIDPGAENVAICISHHAEQFHLSANGTPVASAPAVQALVPEVMRVIDETVLENLTRIRALHCGAVVWAGKALLLPGATHSGKSSLVAALLKRGATYLSDEYAMIDERGWVHPYPRPLLLRNGRPEQSPALASEYNAKVAEGPVAAGWILSLRYDPQAGWDVAPVPQSLALLALLMNTPHEMTQLPDSAAGFRLLVEGSRCYAGTRGEVEDSLDRILELLAT